MRVLRSSAILAASLLLTAHAGAVSYQLTFNGTVSTVYDFATGQTRTLATPEAFTVVATLPIGSFTSTPDAYGTLTDYDASGLMIASPFRNLVGPDPIASGAGYSHGEMSAQAYVQTFQNGSDTQFTLSQLVEHFTGQQSWQYSASLVLGPLGPGVPATPTPVLTPDKLAAYLAGQVGQPARYTTEWDEQAIQANGQPMPTAGLAWVNPVTTLTDLRVLGAVPEPGTWVSFLVGFGLVGAASRMRSARGRRYSVDAEPL